MRLSAILVSAFFSLAAVSAEAGNNDKGGYPLIERGINLLSKRSTSMIKVSHQRRSRLLAKRGNCPIRKPINGTTTVTTEPGTPSQGGGGGESGNSDSNGGDNSGDDGEEEKPVPAPSTSSASTINTPKEEEKTPDPQPNPTTSTTKSSSSSPSSTYTPPKTTSQAPAQTPDPEPETPSYAADQLGPIHQFQGENSGIMSWFRTDSGSDSTNGESWCQTRYQDDWPCFAPSVGTMLKDFGYDYNKAAKAYCGREVLATNPVNGKQAKLFICDGFDDRWVLSAESIDATIGAFTTLHGSFDWNKNTVVHGLKWELTGGVVEKGTFKYGK